MKKYSLLAFFLAVLTLNNAYAREYIYQNNNYNYHPRYHRITREEAQKYEEKKLYKEETPTNKIRPYIGLNMTFTGINFKNNRYVEGIGETEQLDHTYYTHAKYKKSLNTNALSGYVGAKFNNYWGAEIYYQKSSKEKTTKDHLNTDLDQLTCTTSTLDYQSYGADIISYIPFNQNIEILVALGLGQYDFNYKLATKNTVFYNDGEISEVNRNYKKDFDSLGIRLGLGAQYNITDHIALRGLFRYIKMTDADFVKDLTEISLGMQYMF